MHKKKWFLGSKKKKICGMATELELAIGLSLLLYPEGVGDTQVQCFILKKKSRAFKKSLNIIYSCILRYTQLNMVDFDHMANNYTFLTFCKKKIPAGSFITSIIYSSSTIKKYVS